MSTTANKPWAARLSARLLTPFVDTALQPNHLTALRLAVGLAGVAAFCEGSMPNLAALLIVLSNFLDHADGELARMTGRFSRFGHYFDLASDAIVTIGMFVGIGVGLSDAHPDAPTMLMGLTAGVAIALMFHLRNKLETRLGKQAVAQPMLGGFQVDDIMFLLPLVTLSGVLFEFLVAATLGAPLALIIIAAHYVYTLRRIDADAS